MQRPPSLWFLQPLHLSWQRLGLDPDARVRGHQRPSGQRGLGRAHSQLLACLRLGARAAPAGHGCGHGGPAAGPLGPQQKPPPAQSASSLSAHPVRPAGCAPSRLLPKASLCCPLSHEPLRGGSGSGFTTEAPSTATGVQPNSGPDRGRLINIQMTVLTQKKRA